MILRSNNVALGQGLRNEDVGSRDHRDKAFKLITCSIMESQSRKRASGLINRFSNTKEGI